MSDREIGRYVKLSAFAGLAVLYGRMAWKKAGKLE